MRIDVFACINDTKADDLAHKTVIVIDALRATSTIVAALSAGCAAVLTAETVGGATQLRQPGDLLGGERFCRKIAGFDFGNSPLEYTADAVAGKRVVLTTTNGTRCVHKAVKAAALLIGAFLNGPACAETAMRLKRDVAILCAGVEDQFALEDGLCAGYIASELLNLLGGDAVVSQNDHCLAMIAAFKQAQPNLIEALSLSRTGKKLIRLGMADDVGYCAQTDCTDTVPALQGGLLVRFQLSGCSKTPVHS